MTLTNRAPGGIDETDQRLAWTRDSRWIIFVTSDYGGPPDAARDPRCSAP